MTSFYKLFPLIILTGVSVPAVAVLFLGLPGEGFAPSPEGNFERLTCASLAIGVLSLLTATWALALDQMKVWWVFTTLAIVSLGTFVYAVWWLVNALHN